MDVSHVRINAVDDPPCACGNDLGVGSTRMPQLVAGSEKLAQPTGLVGIAVEIPATRFAWCVVESGRVVSRVRLTKGDIHVMYSPLGGSQQFCLETAFLDPANPKSSGAFGRVDYGGDINNDPRAVLLRHFWSGSKYQQGFDVEPFAVKRTGPVFLPGQFAMVSIGTRWFDDDGTVHASLGGCYIVPQGVQTRFLKPAELAKEFLI
jgi:hypothetical protein